MNWLQRAGAALALAATLGLGAGAMSASAQTRPAMATQAAAIPQAATQTALSVPRMPCNGNGFCGYAADWTGYLTIEFDARTLHLYETPRWVDGVKGCFEGIVGIAFFSLIPGVGEVGVAGVTFSCLWGGVGRALWP